MEKMPARDLERRIRGVEPLEAYGAFIFSPSGVVLLLPKLHQRLILALCSRWCLIHGRAVRQWRIGSRCANTIDGVSSVSFSRWGDGGRAAEQPREEATKLA